MLNKKKASILSFASVSALLLFTGCSQQTSSPTSNGVDTTSVDNATAELTLYVSTGVLETQNVQDQLTSLIKKKFPNVTLDFIYKNNGSPDYPDLINSGKNLDLVMEASNSTSSKIINYGLEYDLAPLIAKYKTDLNRFDPGLLEQIKKAGDGKLYALPFTGAYMVLFYNKDIFDKLGVSYPTDGLTWDQAYSLAQKLTKSDQGTQYYGFTANSGLYINYNELGQSWLDASDQASVMNDSWNKWFANLQRFFQIPGNPVNSVDDFPKGQIAMDLHLSGKMTYWPQQNPQLNWDMVSAPTFSDAPGVGFQPNEYSLYVTSTSAYKDLDFNIITYILSDDVQMQLSKKGTVTPLVGKQIQAAFGQDMTDLKGKNFGAVYKNKFPTPPHVDSYTYSVNSAVSSAFNDMLKTNADINSELRSAADAINKKVSDLKQQSGK
ncbi:MAG: transporter substrate-binding protein [Bacilli bacterium]|nr:transporter substrate-binding protein [Bacilli bacterium]